MHITRSQNSQLQTSKVVGPGALGRCGCAAELLHRLLHCLRLPWGRVARGLWMRLAGATLSHKAYKISQEHARNWQCGGHGASSSRSWIGLAGPSSFPSHQCLQRSADRPAAGALVHMPSKLRMAWPSQSPRGSAFRHRASQRSLRSRCRPGRIERCLRARTQVHSTRLSGSGPPLRWQAA